MTTITAPVPGRTNRAASTAGTTRAIPYAGDDWAQNLARIMALPMLAMGLMTVAGGLLAGIVSGVSFSEFFAPGGEVADLGRAEAAVQVTGATLFLGMGFILGGITMTLVNVVRSLRDAGRDVQQSLGAQPLQLRKPLTGRLTPHIMMMGVMIEVVAFVLGLVAAFAIGGVDPAAIADPATASAGDLGDIGFVRAVGAWLPGLRLVGVAVILGSIVLTLTTIRSAIRFQGDRITELANGA